MKKTTLLVCTLFFLLSSCSTFLSNSGPSKREVDSAEGSSTLKGIQLIDVSDKVVTELLKSRKLSLFSEVFGSHPNNDFFVDVGDVIEVMVWESSPKALFGNGSVASIVVGGGNSNMVSFPPLMVDNNGEVNIPYCGKIPVKKLTISQIENEVIKRLRGRANQPQVIVRMVGNNSSNVTVMGDVNASREFPLSYKNERILNAIASAGGVKQDVNKTSIQLTRGDAVYSLPLEFILRDPKQNIFLKPGDVVTALYKSYSFSVLGATGKNEEVNFEAQGITLAQALARVGGLNDNRANTEGVYIFRLEKQGALDLGKRKLVYTPDGRIPVIYRIDMRDPTSFFNAQSFPIENRDVLFVANSSQAQLQKFLSLIQGLAITSLGIMNIDARLDK